MADYVTFGLALADIVDRLAAGATTEAAAAAEFATAATELNLGQDLAALTAAVTAFKARLTNVVVQAGPPPPDLGRVGTMYLDDAALKLYGPKTSSGWGGGMSMVGRDGLDASGDVVGPAGATDGHLVQFDGATGRLVKGGRAVGVAGPSDLPDRSAADARYLAAAMLGLANGVMPLGSDGKADTAFLPDAVLGALRYQTAWDAAANNPVIPAAAPANKGRYYVVSTAGSTSVGGVSDWKVGDWVVSNGAAWEKIDNTDQVVSVAGLIGAISAASLKAALALAIADIAGLQAALDAKAALSGGAFSGTISAPTVSANGGAGTSRLITWCTAGSLRWSLEANTTAEGGGNAGSNLVLLAYDDAGASQGSVLNFVRSTKLGTFAVRPMFGAATPWDSVNLASVTQAEAEAGTATTARAWTAQRVAQAITTQAMNTRVKTISAAAYTVLAADHGLTLHLTHAGPTVTLPNDLPDTFNCLWRSWGGQATFAAASGATLSHPDNHTKSAKAKASGGLEVVTNAGGSAANWLLSGYTAS